MPTPNLNNPPCEKCGKHTTYNMTTTSGARQYRCRRHKPNYIYTDSDNPPHRPCDGEQPLTQIEKNQRYRDANRAKYRAAQKLRRDRKKHETN